MNNESDDPKSLDESNDGSNKILSEKPSKYLYEGWKFFLGNRKI